MVGGKNFESGIDLGWGSVMDGWLEGGIVIW